MNDFETQVVERLARMETKIDHIADHETRIRTLERMIWIAAGAATAGGGVVGAALGNLF